MQSVFRQLLPASVVAILLASGQLVAATVYVIGNPELKVSSEDIVDIFSGEKQSVGFQRLTPIDNKAVQGEFLTAVLKVSLIKYKSTWAKKSFRDGVQIPEIRGGDAEVIEFVKSTPGAIGYVHSEPKGVRVISQF